MQPNHHTMNKVFFFSLCLFSLLLNTHLTAQIQTPAASPRAVFSQQVGLTDVTIEYFRPSKKGRTLFAADGLVRFGETWRTGANSATKLSFSDGVTLGGAELKAGDYAILTVPGAKEWKVMVYPYESGNWMSYTEKEAAATFTVEASQMDATVETFLINIDNVTATTATIDIIWGSTYVPIPLEVEIDSKVMAAIDKTMAGPTPNDYYNAATYYHESGKDLEKALEWVQIATKVEKPRYWQVRREALILADLGKKKEAITAAQKSLTLAKEAGNMDFVRMNEETIAKLK